MKTWQWIGVLSLVLAGCSSTPSKTTAVDTSDDRTALANEVQEELTIGREMAAKLLGYFGHDTKQPATEEYVQLVGLNLAKRWGRPEIEYRFAILSSNTVNAYATPGGYVFVTKGLLKRLHNESELASVLAHEIAHVNQRHMYLQIRPKRSVDASESVVRLMSRGSTDLSAGLFQIVQAGMKALLEDGLSKEKELEADQLALNMVSAAGYRPEAFVDFLERCQKDEASLKVEGASVTFADRVAVAKQTLKTNGFSADKQTKFSILDGRFKQRMVLDKNS